MPSESRPDSPPKFFIDRSLGRIAVPGLLREAGWDVVTLAEHYGVPEDEDVTDAQWIAETAALGWPVLMKDKRIRYRSAEIETVIEHGARCFVIPRGDLTSVQAAARFLRNHESIYTKARERGPFIYSVHLDRIDPLRLS